MVSILLRRIRISNFYRRMMVITFIILGCHSQENKAIKYAKSYILDILDTPSTVQWINTKILRDTTTNSDKWFIVFLEFDSQNPFGVMLRDDMYVTFRMMGDSVYMNKMFYRINRDFLIKTFYGCESQIKSMSDNQILYLVAVLNGWPGLEEEQKKWLNLMLKSWENKFRLKK